MKKEIVVLCFVVFVISLSAQDQKHEVSSEVKELSSFHTVIYKLWHTAWPQKDVRMLQSMLPEIEKGTQNIVSAKLPGILRDKQSKWESGVAELKKCTDEYKHAAENKDSLALLKSTEILHSQYEKLVRIIRPVIKEVDQLHQELYLLYHYYMPEKNTEKIEASSKILKERMLDLSQAKLPERLSSKKVDFDKAVVNLDVSIKKLNETIENKSDIKKVNETILLVHSNYQALEKVFD